MEGRAIEMTSIYDGAISTEIASLTVKDASKIIDKLETILMNTTTYAQLTDDLGSKIRPQRGFWHIKLTIKTLLITTSSFKELKQSTSELLYRLRDLYSEESK